MKEKPDIRASSPEPRPQKSQSVLESMKGWFQDSRAEFERIEAIVETIEPKIKHVRGYRKQLQRPFEVCREHCKKIVAGIPGPIYLKNSHDYSDPLIKAAFAGSEKIEDLLAKRETSSPEAALSPGSERVALLTMTRTDRTIFGRSKHGEMITGDERLTSTTFSDHKIVGLAETFEASRKQLEKYILKIITDSASHELAVRRADLGALKQRQEELRAMREMFGGDNHTHEMVGTASVDEAENLEKVESMLEETETELSTAMKGYETPKERLAFLEQYLLDPEKIVSVNLVSLRLDWRNVLTENPDEKADTITFAQCAFGEDVTRYAAFIAYKKEHSSQTDLSGPEFLNQTES